jgi:hypothetical protein
VVTPEGVDHLIAGLKAAEAYRQNAKKEDTPYGRYLRASAAYEAAKVKCQEAQPGFVNRLANNEKLSTQFSELMDKAMTASGKGDTTGMKAYQDQALALQDPSCVVKEPARPDDYNGALRDIDTKAEQTATKSSGLTTNEYYWVNERTWLILAGNPPPDISASEKSAVNAKSAELKSLLGIKDQSTERAKKPAPAPEPAPAQPVPGMTQAQTDMGTCMTKNAQKHEKEIAALGERAKAAQEAGDMPTTLAIADTLRVLQMAGCNVPQGQ